MKGGSPEVRLRAYGNPGVRLRAYGNTWAQGSGVRLRAYENPWGQQLHRVHLWKSENVTQAKDSIQFGRENK